jgi:Fur family iron response transcriptional regulator
MIDSRPYSGVLARIKDAGLRPTRQRLALAKLLFDQDDRHVTAEQLRAEAQTAKIPVSLATVYNTLHQFTEAGLLREVVVEAGRSCFDTNTSEHHHVFNERTGMLTDIPPDSVTVTGIPGAADGAAVKRVDVIIRVE